ncbi:MAG: hypothetical protein VX949_00320 [Planctomycetota bacterium]|nr:hypothetical protein [Planctomycetota bacterium]
MRHETASPALGRQGRACHDQIALLAARSVSEPGSSVLAPPSRGWQQPGNGADLHRSCRVWLTWGAAPRYDQAMSNRNNRKVKKANHGKRPANRNRRAAKSAKFKN